MTSSLPPAGGYAPVSSLEAARLGVVRRGNRISSVLLGFLILQLFGAALVLGGAAVGWSFFGRYVGKDVPGLGEVPQLGTLLWVAGVFVLISLVGLALYVLNILTARRAILSVQRYAADPGHQGRPEVRGFTKWLTFWQWYTLVGSLLSLASIPLSLNLSSRLSQLGGTPSSDLDPGQTALLTGITLVSSLLSLVPSVVLSWLILNAVKGFFRGVESHSGGARTPLRPKANTVGSWLIFVIVMLGLLLAFALFYAALLGALVAIPGALGSSSASSQSFGSQSFRQAAPLLIGGGVLFTLLIAAVYGLLIAVVAWSRGFALDTATLLDGGFGSGLPSGSFNSSTMNSGVDAWRSAVTPPKPPL